MIAFRKSSFLCKKGVSRFRSKNLFSQYLKFCRGYRVGCFKVNAVSRLKNSYCLQKTAEHSKRRKFSEHTMIYWLTSTLWLVCNFSALWESTNFTRHEWSQFGRKRKTRCQSIWWIWDPTTTSTWNLRVNSDSRPAWRRRKSKYKRRKIDISLAQLVIPKDVCWVRKKIYSH